MDKIKNNTTNISDREIVITRVFDAPRELVFEAFTDPEHIAEWWGPDGFTTTIHEMDVRPGGVWKFTMHGPDGTDYPGKIVYEEILKPERMVFTQGCDPKDPDAQFHSAITFDEQGEKTKVTMQMLFQTADERNKVVKEYHAIEGGNQMLTRLEEYLRKISEKEILK